MTDKLRSVIEEGKNYADNFRLFADYNQIKSFSLEEVIQELKQFEAVHTRNLLDAIIEEKEEQLRHINEDLEKNGHLFYEQDVRDNNYSRNHLQEDIDYFNKVREELSVNN